MTVSGQLGMDAFGPDNSGHDTDCDCKACLIDTWHAEVDELRAEIERLRNRSVCPHVAAQTRCGVSYSGGSRCYVMGWRCDDCPGGES